MVISLIGIYAVNTRIFDAGLAIVMGVLGYILLRLQWPIVNLVMGLVLGDILENRLRESFKYRRWQSLDFLHQPIRWVS
jgi:putative tricarboxylic transport membrane protein